MIHFVGPCLFLLLTVGLIVPAAGGMEYERDVLPGSGGEVAVTFIGHGSLMLEYQGKVIHIDPYSRVADYAQLPKADIILLTHHHQDHLDETALNLIRTPATEVVLTEKCAERIDGGLVMDNGDERTVQNISIAAVPAYNIVHRRGSGELFHPRGEGNGYVLSLGGIRIYIAGDTENTPEMKALRDIDYAFLPMNLPYTMTPEMAADAALAFRPRVLYPYHYGETDPNELTALLKDAKDIKVRIRAMR
ncbi:MAG TPA: MBL fold metallo-hydrolase [Desulfobacteraceae bacterium]|nr:MBL fold metallo-hydrolase [Desulfobacteraceae bacterium]